MEHEENDESAANSEMRYITLELMKLAQKSGRSFAEVAEEYLKNAHKLQRMIAGEKASPVKRKASKQIR
ncbi:MAG: hypothetical protein NT051_02945 [Candidatus Micrarchaeota archaeon]|nr:hypothetical protein [Candidatus Micrarchaeota archaeon]